MQDDDKKAIQTEIDYAQKDTRNSFYLWYCVNIFLGLFTIIIPALGTLLSDDKWILKLCAGLGSISAGIYAFLRPDRIASAYDWACQHVWKTDVAFNCRQIEGAQVSDRLAEAISATTFRYVSSAGPSASNVEISRSDREVSN